MCACACLQIAWSWSVYASGHSGGLAGCAADPECSPSNATDEQLRRAFKNLVVLTASHDALYDEGTQFVARAAAAADAAAAPKEKATARHHHIKARGSHLGALLYDTAAWAQLISTAHSMLSR